MTWFLFSIQLADHAREGRCDVNITEKKVKVVRKIQIYS